MKLSEVFNKNKKVFIPYITSGFPSVKDTVEIIKLFIDLGIEILEIGIPFSDPVADGTTIQYSSFYALQKGISIDKTFDIVNKINNYGKTNIVIMTYLNPVIIYGIEKFFKTIAEHNIKGIIFPDIIPEEKNIFYKLTNKYEIDTIFLLSLVTAKKRRQLVYKHSSGFVYLVTVTGTTGVREILPKYFYNFVKLVRTETEKPLCVGFGISKPEHIKPVIDYIDGFIIGSAIVNIMKNFLGKERLQKIRKFVSQFKF